MLMPQRPWVDDGVQWMESNRRAWALRSGVNLKQ